MGGLHTSQVKSDENGSYFIDKKTGKRVAIGENGPVATPDPVPLAPSPTDEALRKRRSNALLQAGLGYGRRSTMLTSGMTAGIGEPMLQKTTLGGY